MKSSAIINLLCLIIATVSQSYAQTPVPAGPVSGTWGIGGSPYLIQGDITLAEGEQLTIEPGVRVEFQGHYSLYVQGSLMAAGTVSDSIMFTINDSTGFHNINSTDGGWHGIRFGYLSPGSDSSRIRYCVFAFGKAVGTTTEDKSGGAIAVNQYDDLVISNAVFVMNAAQESGGAVAVAYSDIQLYENSFMHCRAKNGGGIGIYSSSPELWLNLFVDNHAENSGGGVSLFYNSHCEITDNLFAGNFANYGGALQIESNCNPVLRNNLIYSNVAYEEGGGADLEENCQAAFINNTIVGNFALFGGGIDVEVNSSPVFRNTIIRGNTAFVDGSQIHLFSEDSDPDFYYCDIEGGADSIGTWYGGSIYLNYTGTFENNIDLDPVFINQGFYMFLLDDSSPCIDAGDPDVIYNDIEDPANPGFALWPSKGLLRNDMGVYGGPYVLTWDVPTAIEEPALPHNAAPDLHVLSLGPNPTAGEIDCKFYQAVNGCLTLKIYDASMREVQNHDYGSLQAGEHEIRIDLSPLQPGIYFLFMGTGHEGVVRKMVKR